MVYYVTTILVYAGVDAIACLGLSQQFGIAGVTNFGFIIFQAAGAYAAAVLSLPPESANGGFQTYIGGLNQRKPTMSRPIETHSMAGMRFGGGTQPPMAGGIRRVTSKKPTGTSSAPRIAPTLLPRPPTITAANRMIVSG